VAGPGRATPLTLPTDGGQIDRLYAATCETHTVYFYELTDQENGWSVVVGVNGSGTIAYRTELGGFNLTQPALEGSIAYVAAIGYIARLDLLSGTIVWSHKDLLEHDSAFNVFDVPVIGQTDVVFRARISPAATEFAKVVVDKVSGKIKEFSRGD
jgi:hypothetical protein